MNTHYTQLRTNDLIIERKGDDVIQITKSGVVIWPPERHTAGMQTDKLIDAYTDMLEKKRQDENYMSFSNDRANASGGTHYKNPDATGTCPHCKRPIEHWDWAYNLRGLEYAATKYIARWRNKGGLESLKKAIHYIQKIVEIHFPEVAVTIIYGRTEQEFGRSGNECNQSQPATQEVRGVPQCQATESPTMDGLQSEDPHARVDSLKCDFPGCTKSVGHTGLHKGPYWRGQF